MSPSSSEYYTCQYTQLARASTQLRAWDIRQDLRPLFAGNLTVRAFAIAVLTRLFNAVQAAHGGAGFPYLRPGAGSGARLVRHDLRPGDTVRVLRREQIAATLDRTGRNRGLWFDGDMLKHCGRQHTVLKRVDRIIDDATGRMLVMKTPCLLLDGLEASGEFLRFCAQHEYPFWREAWLSPEIRAAAAPATGGTPERDDSLDALIQ